MTEEAREAPEGCLCCWEHLRALCDMDGMFFRTLENPDCTYDHDKMVSLEKPL